MADIKLFSYTRLNPKHPVALEIGEDPSLKELLVYIARVSNPANQSNMVTVDKLVSYLIKHRHWSPFQMVNVCMDIFTTRDIAHQVIRHASFAFQEFSQRYADPTEAVDPFVLRELRFQDPKNRQSSIEPDINHPDDARLILEWNDWQKKVIDASTQAYKWAVKNGIAKEQARAVLPEGLTKTHFYMNGSIRSWIHYIQARHGEDAQKEHRDIAIGAAEAMVEVFPDIKGFLKDPLDK